MRFPGDPGKGRNRGKITSGLAASRGDNRAAAGHLMSLLPPLPDDATTDDIASRAVAAIMIATLLNDVHAVVMGLAKNG